MRQGFLLRAAYRFFGLPEDESPRVLVDIILGMLATAAVVILVVYASETNPSVRLRNCAIASAPIAVGAIVLSKHRIAVITGVVGFIALRVLIGLALR